MARFCRDVWRTSGWRPASSSSAPACVASFSPRSLRSTSTQPVKRLARFHSLSPWRSSTSEGIGRLQPRSLVGGGELLQHEVVAVRLLLPLARAPLAARLAHEVAAVHVER